MSEIISKELLSEVLGHKCIIERFYDEYIYIDSQTEGKGTINIHELADKCKKWIFNHSTSNIGYAIKTIHYGDKVTCGIVGLPDSITYDNKTEPEGVFRTCQWKLDRDNNGNN